MTIVTRWQTLILTLRAEVKFRSLIVLKVDLTQVIARL